MGAIAVDPAGAPCIAASLAEGRPPVVETRETAMAGLDAATPSAAARPILADGLRGAIVVDDGEADEATRDLDERCAALRPRRGVHRALVVVTEGATDPARYEQVLSALT